MFQVCHKNLLKREALSVSVYFYFFILLLRKHPDLAKYLTTAVARGADLASPIVECKHAGGTHTLNPENV